MFPSLEINKRTKTIKDILTLDQPASSTTPSWILGASQSACARIILLCPITLVGSKIYRQMLSMRCGDERNGSSVMASQQVTEGKWLAEYSLHLWCYEKLSEDFPFPANVSACLQIWKHLNEDSRSTCNV